MANFPRSLILMITDLFSNLLPCFRKSPLDALPDEEQRVISFFSELRINWSESIRDLSDRFSSTVDKNGHRLIQLPPIHSLPPSPISFSILHTEEIADYPPTYLWAEVGQLSDPGENFKAIESQLVSVLGSGIRSDVTNCLIRKWNFGIFEFQLLAWPDTGTDSPIKTTSPHSSPKCRLSLSSKLARIYPSERLNFLCDAILSRSDRVELYEVDSQLFSQKIYNPLLFSYRNPSRLASLLSHGKSYAWRDAAQGLSGFSHREISYVFENLNDLTLTHLKLDSARGPEASELIVSGKRGQESATLTLLVSDSKDGLDLIARKLAEVWKTAIKEEYGQND